MTKEELKQHCEKQVKMCEEWAKGNDREPSGKIYEEHKLILDLIKALEQQPSDDCVSRADLIDKLEILDKRYGSDFYWEVRKIVDILPPVTPTFPKGATNGDMIKAMFPKIEIYTDVINEIVDVEICEDSSELRCSIDWWNAPYKRGDENGSN